LDNTRIIARASSGLTPGPVDASIAKRSDSIHAGAPGDLNLLDEICYANKVADRRTRGEKAIAPYDHDRQRVATAVTLLMSTTASETTAVQDG